MTFRRERGALRSGEATAGSVEVPLAGRSDDGCGVTAYSLRTTGICGSKS